jgi:hypothetical protein
MPPYPIYCHSPGCKELAQYKVAALWSDGLTQELKTYALCCAGCARTWFERSRQKQAACRLAKNERLDPPGIYTLERGRRDVQIHRLHELERQILEEKGDA